jgi:hypothetical protein
LVRVACESSSVSSTIGQAKEIRFSIAYRAVSDGVFESFRCRASHGGIDCPPNCGDARRLQRTTFPGRPVQRVPTIVPGSEIDEHDPGSTSDPAGHNISHEELPVILMGNENDIDSGRQV